MENDAHVLIDSDAFVGWLVERDAHHQKITRILEHLKAKKMPLITTSAVVTETATVLSHRIGQQLAQLFLAEVIEKEDFPVVFISESIYHAALTLFKSQTQRGTSFTDCANVIVANQLGLRSIFSFDQAYPKYFGLKLLNGSVPPVQ